MLARSASYLIILFSIFYLPSWYLFLCLVIFSLIFPKYYEPIFFSLFFDILYGYKLENFFGINFIFTIFFIIFVFISEAVKKRIRFGENSKSVFK